MSSRFRSKTHKSSGNSNSLWDPVLLVSQIISLQTLHYLTLALLIPPLLSLFAEPTSLIYEGGATSIGMIMDWREMAGRETVRGLVGEDGNTLTRSWAWASGKKVGFTAHERPVIIDPRRGWIIAFCWLAASSADIYFIYYLIRRPRMVLDFSLTLIFNHLVGTSYYSSSVPTSGFFWLVMVSCAVVTVIAAEQLCVRREMRDGLNVSSSTQGLLADEEVEEMEMGGLRRD